MRLFDENNRVKLILENKNRFVRLAADDLARDIARVSLSGELPEICDRGVGIIIRENSRPDLDPVRDESFSIVCDGERIVISAPTCFLCSRSTDASQLYTMQSRAMGKIDLKSSVMLTR